MHFPTTQTFALPVSKSCLTTSYLTKSLENLDTIWTASTVQYAFGNVQLCIWLWGRRLIVIMYNSTLTLSWTSDYLLKNILQSCGEYLSDNIYKTSVSDGLVCKNCKDNMVPKEVSDLHDKKGMVCITNHLHLSYSIVISNPCISAGGCTWVYNGKTKNWNLRYENSSF